MWYRVIFAALDVHGVFVYTSLIMFTAVTETKFAQLHQLIAQASRVLLVSDGRPDGDSVGASGAMLNWLLREGKAVEAFCARPLPRSLQFIDNAHRFREDDATFDLAYDVVVMFDSSSVQHCGIAKLLKRIPKKYVLVNIDHHATNAQEGDLNIVITEACSTAEIVSRFFEQERIAFDAHIATALLTGILTDTSHFSNSGTTTYGLEVAGRLLAAGARLADIRRSLVRNKTVPRLKLWGIALARLKQHPRYDLAWTHLSPDDIESTGADDESAEGISNFIHAEQASADTTLVLRQTTNGCIKGSLRSVSHDISKLAQAFGGGGHKKASGFMIKGHLVVDEEGKIRIEE